MEGKLIIHIINTLADQDNLRPEEKHDLQKGVTNVVNMFHGFGFCLSQEDDLLSQWRGYADNGTGVSIGFSKDKLRDVLNSDIGNPNRMMSDLREVLYVPEEQIESVRGTYNGIKQLVDKGALKPPSPGGLLDPRSDDEKQKERDDYNKLVTELSGNIILLLPQLYVLKNKAFSEEKEWRLLTHTLGNSFSGCSFRPAGNTIAPYCEYRIDGLAGSLLTDIVLGPKNQTPIPVIKSYLLSEGFGDVVVRRSQATYR
ncbi:MAG: DUF2971 domain-containing protein [Candidatus Thiodiazotropha sp. (ex Ctena orbiculata)]|nr:DUF2971 domain-containing protein [Candidatus Thiodiazotropha taylori]